MKLSNITLLATSALAFESFELEITSSNNELNGKGLLILHEGAGAGVFGISDTHDDKYLYDAKNKTLFQYQASLQANLGIWGPFLAIGPAVDPKDVTFDSEGNLIFVENIYACKNVTDAYNYFTDKYGLIVGEVPNETCVDIGLKKVN